MPIFVTLGLLSLQSTSLLFKVDKIFDDETLNYLKPISRQKLLLSKLLAAWILVFVVSTTFLIFASFFSLLDKTMTAIGRSKYVFSIFVGSIVVMFLMQGLMVFLSNFIKGKGMVATSTILIFTLPIFSIVNQMYVKKDFLFEKTYQSFSPNNALSIQKTYSMNFTDKDKTQKTSFETHEKSYYKYTSKVDFYYQFNSFFEIFQDRSKTNQYYFSKRETVAKESDYTFEIDNSRYVVLLAKPIGDPQEFRKRVGILLESKDLFNALTNHKDTIEQFGLDQQIAFSRQLILSATQNLSLETKITNAISEVEKLSDDYLKLLFSGIRNEQLELLRQFNENGLNVSTHTKVNVVDYVSQNFGQSSVILLEKDSRINIFIKKQYVNTTLAFVLWLIIITVLVGAELTIKRRILV